MPSTDETAISNSKLRLTESEWKCQICCLTFPNHNALIGHMVAHIKSVLTQYPYSIQEEIIRRLVEDQG